jgi:hypothetical protein
MEGNSALAISGAVNYLILKFYDAAGDAIVLAQVRNSRSSPREYFNHSFFDFGQPEDFDCQHYSGYNRGNERYSNHTIPLS